MKPTEGEMNLIALVNSKASQQHILLNTYQRCCSGGRRKCSTRHHENEFSTESKMLNSPSWLEEDKQLEAQIETVKPPSSSSS